jgi:hypothetical protein
VAMGAWRAHMRRAQGGGGGDGGEAGLVVYLSREFPIPPSRQS